MYSFLNSYLFVKKFTQNIFILFENENDNDTKILTRQISFTIKQLFNLQINVCIYNKIILLGSKNKISQY